MLAKCEWTNQTCNLAQFSMKKRVGSDIVFRYLLTKFKKNLLLQFLWGVRVAQWVRSLDLTTRTSLSPIRRGFVLSFVNYKKWCTRLAATSDKVYQLLAQGQWFSPGTPTSSTTKTGCHDIAEILLKVALNTKILIQIQFLSGKLWKPFSHLAVILTGSGSLMMPSSKYKVFSSFLYNLLEVIINRVFLGIFFFRTTSAKTFLSPLFLVDYGIPWSLRNFPRFSLFNASMSFPSLIMFFLRCRLWMWDTRYPSM